MSETDLPVGVLADVSAQLRYALTTDPFPLEASPATGTPESATLKVVGSNPDPSNPVTLSSVVITIPVGSDAAQLTDVKPDDVVPPADWTLQQTKLGENIVEYVFRPHAGKGEIAGQGLTFVFNNIQPNKQSGVAFVEITEGADGPVTQLPVTKFPSDWGEVTFISDPPIVPYGGSPSLRWSGPGSATYAIQYYTPRTGIVNVPGAGEQPLANRGRYPAQNGKPLQLFQNTIFYLTVSGVVHGKSYSAQKFLDVTVTAMPPEITCFKSEPATVYGFTIAKEGRDTIPAVEITLSWTTEHAKECELSGVPQLLATNTSLPQSVTQSKTFLLKAYGSVDPPATKSLNVGFMSAVRIAGQLRHLQPAQYELIYTFDVVSPTNSDVQIEIIMFGKAVHRQMVSNHTSVDQSYGTSGNSYYDRWDDNASMVFTCTGNTTYKLVCPLASVVGPTP